MPVIVQRKPKKSIVPSTNDGPKFKNWNDFQTGTKGQFSSRSDAAKAWEDYKNANGIVTGTVRSQAAISEIVGGQPQYSLVDEALSECGTCSTRLRD